MAVNPAMPGPLRLWIVPDFGQDTHPRIIDWKLRAFNRLDSGRENLLLPVPFLYDSRLAPSPFSHASLRPDDFNNRLNLAADLLPLKI